MVPAKRVTCEVDKHLCSVYALTVLPETESRAWFNMRTLSLCQILCKVRNPFVMVLTLHFPFTADKPIYRITNGATVFIVFNQIFLDLHFSQSPSMYLVVQLEHHTQMQLMLFQNKLSVFALLTKTTIFKTCKGYKKVAFSINVPADNIQVVVVAHE